MKTFPSKMNKTRSYILEYLLKFNSDEEREMFVHNCRVLSLKFSYEINNESCILKNTEISSYICKEMNIATLFPNTLYEQVSNVYYLHYKNT